MKDIKKGFLRWVSEENFLQTKENVIYAERIFTAYSIAKWCLGQKNKEQFTDTEVEIYALVIRQFLQKELDLFWEYDKLYMNFEGKVSVISEEKKHESGSISHTI